LPTSAAHDVVCGLWFMVCGLWFVVYGLWFVVCGLWFVISIFWLTVYGLPFGVQFSCLDVGLGFRV
jgi:hypothetical protein